MFFRLLDVILDPRERYRIYIDIKDTHSSARADKLGEILCNAKYDFEREMVERIQPIRSHESALMQLTDLIIGAIGYHNRNLNTSTAKQAVVNQIKQRSKCSLQRSTYLGARKFNLFHWQPKGNA